MTYPTVRRNNPYIIGRPIDEPELFLGRESLFQSIQDYLIRGEKVILLHGQRRIGKSSVLLNIPKFVTADLFVFIHFDLQYHSQASLSQILTSLAGEIIEGLELENKIELPSVPELETDPYLFSSQLLPQVYEEFGDQNLVILIDEFDALINENSGQISEKFIRYLYSIVVVEPKLKIVLFVGRKSTELPAIVNLFRIFKNVPTIEIGLLDERSTENLITKPAKNTLKYEPDAIKTIIELSGGHPYFTQVICFAIFGRARQVEKWGISRQDVENIIDKAIEIAEAGLVWFWDGLSILEQVVFSAVAKAQQIAIDKGEKVPEEPLEILKRYGIYVENSLKEAKEQLRQTGLLDETGSRVKIELVRRWLVQRHPLKQEIAALEKLDREEINRLGIHFNKKSAKSELSDFL